MGIGRAKAAAMGNIVVSLTCTFISIWYTSSIRYRIIYLNLQTIKAKKNKIIFTHYFGNFSSVSKTQ